MSGQFQGSGRYVVGPASGVTRCFVVETTAQGGGAGLFDVGVCGKHQSVLQASRRWSSSKSTTASECSLGINVDVVGVVRSRQRHRSVQYGLMSVQVFGLCKGIEAKKGREAPRVIGPIRVSVHSFFVLK